MALYTVKSWRDVIDREVASRRLRMGLEDRVEKIRLAGIPLPASMKEELHSGLGSPHLTVAGLHNLVSALRYYEQEYKRVQAAEATP